MRERLLSRGPEALADYEILEMLLFLGIARRDTKPLAKQLINSFGSLAGVLMASSLDLATIGGLGPDAIAIVRLPAEAAQRLARAEARTTPMLANWDRLLEYLGQALAGAVPGQLRVLLLDNRNRLLVDETVEGELKNVPHVVAGRALTVHATALILIRVVPGGAPDKTLLRREAALAGAVRTAVSLLSVILHDHMLVGMGNWISLTQKGLL